MGKTLPKKLRVKWDALIETEGKKLGLENCRPFLENKMVNDIFYEGLFNGRPCIVKCSSKAPDSILNEYTLSKSIFDIDQSIIPEPFAYYIAPNGQMAFVIVAKITGKTLTELLKHGVSEVETNRFTTDILRLADALEKTGVVHRDLYPDNFMLDGDGHLKAIDFQFAINRNNYHECRWMKRNWKYRYVIFGVNRNLPRGEWNDFLPLADMLTRLPDTPVISAAVKCLHDKAERMTFKNPLSACIKMKLSLYALSLRIQNLVHFPNSDKTNRLKRRLAVLERI